ncbi:MAG: DUF697 domain-containing protein [Saprospiraceae bacterium]|nr:DUF697 domain-containing protein [Saprospiraceae bacterium]MCB9322929.1 DUF697 domain-containing protein [Lewinellaceae bacterium]
MSNTTNNDKDQKSMHADTVIKNHIVWAMGASFIPLPVIDVFAVSGLQLDMVKGLCRVYDVNFSETQGKAIVTTLTSSALARIGARSLIKLVPGIGSLIGGVTLSVFNGASTYALGEVFKKHFSAGGTFLDFDTERLKKYYREKFEKGKKVAEQIKKEEESKIKKTKKINVDDVVVEAPANMDEVVESDVLKRLSELGALKKEGIITDEEFEAMKKKLIDSF